MIRPSAWRRIRVVRWSSRNSCASASGSSVARSISSRSFSWRCSSDWFRRDRLRKTRLTPLRSCACSTAASTAVRCTAENASAVSVTSLVLVPRSSGGASTATSTSPPARSRLTTLGSRSSASVRAAPRSPVSSRLIRLPNPSSRTEETMTASSPAPPTTIDVADDGIACPSLPAGDVEPGSGLRGGELGEDRAHARLPGRRAHRERRAWAARDDRVLQFLQVLEGGRGVHRRIRVGALLPVVRRVAKRLEEPLVVDRLHEQRVLGRGHDAAAGQHAAHQRGLLADVLRRLALLEHRLRLAVLGDEIRRGCSTRRRTGRLRSPWWCNPRRRSAPGSCRRQPRPAAG